MYTHNFPMHLVRALAPPRFAAAVLVTLALLSSACSDSASHITSPALRVSLSNSPSAAASSFAVLAKAAVTCTDGTITGNVGTFLAPPNGSVTLTNCPITGTVNVGDAVAKQAVRNFNSTYAALATTPCNVVLTGTLAGLKLRPGVYCFDAAATVTGVLTLGGPSTGIWLFKIGTTGTGGLTGTNFSVVMASGQACNVTWWVAGAAAMTTSTFKGNILAGAGITLTGGTFNGNAWSKADVTITGTAVTGC
jgi:Ice-binding-like